MYAYTNIFSKFKKFNPSRITNKVKVDPTTRARCQLRRLPDGLMKELLDKITVPANTDDHDVPLLDRQPTVVPTYSVVELPKPGQDPDQPETEEANIRGISGHGVIASAVQHTVAR